MTKDQIEKLAADILNLSFSRERVFWWGPDGHYCVPAASDQPKDPRDAATISRQMTCKYHARKPKYPTDPQPTWVQGVCAFCGVDKKQWEDALEATQPLHTYNGISWGNHP